MSDTGPTDNGGGQTPNDDRLTSRSEWSNWTVMALLVLCFFAIYYLVPKFRKEVPVEGMPQLELQLEPLIGVQQPVESGDLTGRVVLLNFWGTWCPPCRREFPHLAAIHEKFSDQKAFRMLSVSCGPPDGPEDLASLRRDTELFLQQMEVEMPIYADPNLVSRKAVDAQIGFQGYPTTLIIGRQGKIRGTFVGFNAGDETKMEAMIDKLLAEG